MFEALYADPAPLKSFLAAMTGISHGSNLAIASKFPWARCQTFADVGTAQGDPAMQIVLAMWWPHTEAIYATTLAYSLTPDGRFLAWLERVDAYAFTHFSDPGHGEWYGYCDRRGELTSTAKGNNYKGCFHVLGCCCSAIGL